MKGRKIMSLLAAVALFVCCVSATLLIFWGGNNSSNNLSGDDSASLHRRRRQLQLDQNHRTRPHSIIDQHQPPAGGMITRDAHGNWVEVASRQEELAEQKRPQQTRIINGIEVQHSQYPFLAVMVNSKGNTKCGGALIAANIILTAAHCEGYYTFRIWNGTALVERTVAQEEGSVVVHPNFNWVNVTNDIALMKLSEPALPVVEVTDESGPTLRKHWDLVDTYNWETPPLIRLQRHFEPTGCTSFSQEEANDLISNIVVIGLGITEDGELSDELKMADKHYVLNENCNEIYKEKWGENFTWIFDDMLCAADLDDADGDEEQDACAGDSGGPLVAQLPVRGVLNSPKLLTLVGVVSWGDYLCDPNFGEDPSGLPGVYSRVRMNTDWIDETVCGDNGLSPLSCTVATDGKLRIIDYALKSVTETNSNVSRRTKKNVAQKDARLKTALYGEEWEKEVCELLGGSVDEVRLTPAPTPLPTTNDSSSRPSSTKAKDVSSRFCPSRNNVDLKRFRMKNAPKYKNCKWVKKRCSALCPIYNGCCPKTCSKCMKFRSKCDSSKSGKGQDCK